MEREIDWIKRALAQNSEKTQTGLAKALGLDKSAVSRLLHGSRRLKFAEARAAAEYLGVNPPSGFHEDPEAFEAEPAAGAMNRSSTPLYRVSSGDNGCWLIDWEDIVERRPRAPELRGAASYGFYVPDEAMAPRFRIGEIAWINPARPPAPGEDALLIAAPKNKQNRIFLCEFGQIEPESWKVKQYRNNRTRIFSKKSWQAFYVLPRF